MIKKETLNEIINYLINEPYAKVAGLLSLIQADINQPKEEKETEE